MAVVKRIVCLANSRKPGGRCVAGIEIDDKWQRVGWIRPVSDREDQAVTYYEQQYQDNSLPCVLDIVDVPLKKAQPHEHQQENWLLDGTQRWVKAGAASWEDLTRWGDCPKRLWIDGYHTGPGRNNKIPNAVASELKSSLYLFKVDSLMIHVVMDGARKRVQGRFRHFSSDYWLWITDLGYEQKYLDKPVGRYKIEESFLTVSLGEPYDDGNCHKLIAAIIERSEVRT